jgi:hypothetical protein
LTGKEPPPPRDWEAVVALAERLHLSPLLYRLLQQAQIEIPAPLHSRLANAYWTTLARNVRYQHRLGEIAHALADVGSRVVVLKGLALAAVAYPDLGTRGMADMDLLVREADANRAVAVLQQLGYVPEKDVSGHPAEFCRRYGEGQRFHGPGPFPAVVELHWRLLDYEWFREAIAVPVDDLWQRIVPLPMEGIAAWQLAPEDTLLYLCLHMAVHHSYSEVRFCVDLDRWIRRHPNLDWAACVQRAQVWRLGSIVYFALDLAHQLLDTPVPAAVWEQIRPAALTRWWFGRLVAPAQLVHGRAGLGLQAQRLLHWVLVDSWPARLRGLWRAFFPGREWIAARYAVKRFPGIVLYYALHPLRIIGLAFRALAQLLRRGRKD